MNNRAMQYFLIAIFLSTGVGCSAALVEDSGRTSAAGLEEDIAQDVLIFDTSPDDSESNDEVTLTFNPVSPVAEPAGNLTIEANPVTPGDIEFEPSDPGYSTTINAVDSSVTKAVLENLMDDDELITDLSATGETNDRESDRETEEIEIDEINTTLSATAESNDSGNDRFLYHSGLLNNAAEDDGDDRD